MDSSGSGCSTLGKYFVIASLLLTPLLIVGLMAMSDAIYDPAQLERAMTMDAGARAYWGTATAAARAWEIQLAAMAATAIVSTQQAQPEQQAQP